MNDKYSYRKWLYLLIVLLLLPALWINLGVLAFIDDEAIRALVALEMKLSGNYITPTLHGEYYYNKPPLFNWILLAFFNLAGTFNEFVARFPTTLALMGYGLTIFYFFRKHYDVKTSFLNAFVFITCGRVLFWDSMLGLIDITFSWVTFTGFMVIFHQFKNKNWYALFLLSYLLAALGFLMKGLPSIVFQGTTLLVFFIYKREFKRLFSLPHILGGLLFLLIVGSYYYAYNEYNSLTKVYATLFTESSKRTVVNYGVGRTILHFFTFPFEMVYHFSPWSLMIIYFIRRDIISLIKKDDFITYNLLIFLANLLVYWTSPEVYPRYLLMLAPLIFSSFIYLHQFHQQKRTLQFKFLGRLFLALCFGIAAGSLAPIFLERTQEVPYLYLKTIGWFIGLSVSAVWYYRVRQERLLLLVLFLVVFRIGFNWFVIPDRNENDYGDICRQTSIEMGEKFKEEGLFVYKYTEMQPTNSFYLTNARMEIIPVRYEEFPPKDYYIIYPKIYPEVDYEKHGEIKVRHGKMTFEIVQLKQ